MDSKFKFKYIVYKSSDLKTAINDWIQLSDESKKNQKNYYFPNF